MRAIIHLFLDESNEQKIFHMSISIFGIIFSDNLYSTNRIQEFVTFRKRLTINLEKTLFPGEKIIAGVNLNKTDRN